ncbi:PDZ domain-containing protein, partial [bacterium]|nr:PDZ domain-containing protein [bacterium]
SGSIQGFSLPGKEVRHSGWRTEPVTVGALVGLHSVEPIETGRLAGDIALGPVRFPTPAVRRIDSRGTPLFGAAVLEHFVVTIDGPRRLARFVPAAAESVISPEPVRGVGIGWRLLPEALEVATVLPGSPADRAGIRVGDRITERDGVPIAEAAGCGQALRDRERAEFTVRRGPEEFRVTLTRDVLLP